MSFQNNSTPLKLSILVCVRNKGANIKAMFKILHAMIEVSHEILFIHDDPDDDCVELVNSLKSRDPNTRLIHNQSGIGVAIALTSAMVIQKSYEYLIYKKKLKS